jgi:hypothetical protein
MILVRYRAELWVCSQSGTATYQPSDLATGVVIALADHGPLNSTRVRICLL